MSTAPRVEAWRRLALYLLLFSMVGVWAELVLLEHLEDRLQWTPLLLLSLGIVIAATTAWRSTRATVLALRYVMVLFIVAGAFGIFLHLKSNIEFELEVHPSARGFALLNEALHGAMPALAPGTMAQLGLLGLLVCLRHPSLTKSTLEGSDTQQSGTLTT